MLFSKKKKVDYPPMRKILLVHGYGTSVSNDFLSTATKGLLKLKGQYKGFKAFNHLVKKGKASLFSWNDNFKAEGLKDYLSTERYLDLYRREKQKAISPELQEAFKNYLEKESTEIIVGHSMGCFLILNYMEKHRLPESIKKVFLIQGDFDKNYELTSKDAIHRVEKGDLRIINIYCPWDTTLMLSPFVNKMIIPAGLTRTRNPYFVDVLFPLSDNLNLHSSSIKSTDLLDFILKY